MGCRCSCGRSRWNGRRPTVGLPTGSSDPFAPRRAALAALAVHRTHPALSELSLADALTVAARHQPLDVPPAVIDGVAAFLTRRLEQTLTEEGRPLEHIRAALVHAQRPARTEATLTQLAALADTPDFDRLVQTMQRARTIVPAATAPHYDPSVLAEPAEIHLHDTLGKTRAPARRRCCPIVTTASNASRHTAGSRASIPVVTVASPASRSAHCRWVIR